MPINQRAKGARGERQWAKYLRDHGIDARRGVQYQGGENSPDVVSELGDVHFEVKNTERLRLHNAMKQAKRDAGDKKFPMVAYKKNREPWVICMYADDAMRVLAEDDETNIDNAK